MTDLDQIYQRLGEIQGKLGALEAMMHQPGSCELTLRVAENTTKVRGLELREARRAGGLAVVGVIAGVVGSLVTSAIVSLSIWILSR